MQRRLRCCTAIVPEDSLGRNRACFISFLFIRPEAGGSFFRSRRTHCRRDLAIIGRSFRLIRFT